MDTPFAVIIFIVNVCGYFVKFEGQRYLTDKEAADVSFFTNLDDCINSCKTFFGCTVAVTWDSRVRFYAIRAIIGQF